MKLKLYILIILLAFIIVFLSIKPVYISYITFTSVQPNIQLNLVKTTYNMGDDLDGAIKVTFKGPLEASSKIKLNIGLQETEETFSDILLDLTKQYSLQSGYSEVKNPGTSKTLEYTQAGNKRLALQIPKSAVITSLSLDITGLTKDSSYPLSPKVDILEDENPEFIYLGNLKSYSTTEISSKGLNKNNPQAYTTLNSDKYYCELIDLPYSKDFKINAYYIGADLSAVILPTTVTSSGSSFDVEAKYSANKCTMQKIQNLGSCNINLDKPIQGKNLVCVYSSSAQLYSEYLNSELGYYGYTCGKTYIDDSTIGHDICSPKISNTDIGDFFITVQPAVYSGDLNTKISQSVTDLAKINEYLQDCSINPCILPISVSSDSKGIIKIDNLQVSYGPTTNQIWDIVEIPDIIYEIDGESLTELLIPLSIFNITTPQITGDSKQLKVKISLGTKTDEETITVNKVVNIDEFSLAYELNKTFSSFTVQQREIASSLGYDITNLIQQVSNYKQQIADTLNSTLSDAEKTTKLGLINQELEEIKNTAPLSIKITKKILNIPIQRASEIPEIYLLENQRLQGVKELILSMQSKISIKADLTVLKIKLNNTYKDKTLVQKTITGSLDNFYLIEQIPKTIASSVSDIKFGTDNYEIIQSDPVVRWSVSSLPVTITYAVPGDIISDFNELITLAIPKTISYQPSTAYQNVKCGDGVCTVPLEDKITCPEDCKKKINWLFIVFLVLILIAGVYYINFYRGKHSFKEIAEKKAILFKSKIDETNLRNYIKKSIIHKIPRTKIKAILLSKGWNEKQIEYIFRAL